MIKQTVKNCFVLQTYMYLFLDVYSLKVSNAIARRSADFEHGKSISCMCAYFTRGYQKFVASIFFPGARATLL